MRASDVQREIDRMTTTRIVTDSNGRKHITTEPLLHPEQEPVAIFKADLDCGYVDLLAFQGQPLSDNTLLYTTPPQRKPLTDEEISYLWSWSMTREAELTATTQQHAFARAIEAKLKEKNG
jgi:hypothetical protein